MRFAHPSFQTVISQSACPLCVCARKHEPVRFITNKKALSDDKTRTGTGINGVEFSVKALLGSLLRALQAFRGHADLQGHVTPVTVSSLHMNPAERFRPVGGQTSSSELAAAAAEQGVTH